MLHSFKAATHSNPPAHPRTLESTILASCGQPLHVCSSLQSSFAWAAHHPAQEGGKGLGEAGLAGGRRAQGAVVASSTKKRQWMALVVSMLIGHLLFAHESRSWSKITHKERRMACGGVMGVDVSCCDDIHSSNIFLVHKCSDGAFFGLKAGG